MQNVFVVWLFHCDHWCFKFTNKRLRRAARRVSCSSLRMLQLFVDSYWNLQRFVVNWLYSMSSVGFWWVSECIECVFVSLLYNTQLDHNCLTEIKFLSFIQKLSHVIRYSKHEHLLHDSLTKHAHYALSCKIIYTVCVNWPHLLTNTEVDFFVLEFNLDDPISID